jgi:hypothetical protein
MARSATVAVMSSSWAKLTLISSKEMMRLKKMIDNIATGRTGIVVKKRYELQEIARHRQASQMLLLLAVIALNVRTVKYFVLALLLIDPSLRRLHRHVVHAVLFACFEYSNWKQ